MVDTKSRLVESAADLFAAKGYRSTTVAEICGKAGANIAAVNYHFGSKEGLYEEVWRHLMGLAEKSSPAPDDGLSPDEYLRRIIRQRVAAIFDPGPAGRLPRILNLQLSSPAAETDRLMEKYLEPRLRKMEEAIGAILAAPPDSFATRSCAMSLQAQIIILNVCRRARERLFRNSSPTARELDELTDHIIAFSLGGIGAIRTRLGLAGSESGT